ncbi:O-linked N-acetylglucosamine transferase [Amycolatopsis minnesotensis]|uniref:Uncharacterized protein n=1 Tax=Amycolatopsis minnesotensis TaxID=337894 RepID=A0ABN2Q8F1_9PSEU
MNPTPVPPPDCVDVDAVGEVHVGVTKLLELLEDAGSGSDAVLAACAACLEATRSVTSVATGQQDPATGCQEALHAANAASLAIRFALVENADARRAAAS